MPFKYTSLNLSDINKFKHKYSANSAQDSQSDRTATTTTSGA
jgi:hypothetical protein